MPYISFKQTVLAASLAFGLSFSAFANTVVQNPTPQTAAAHRQDDTTKMATNSVAKPAVAPLIKNNKPNRITSTIKGDPATARAFTWFTSDPQSTPVVKIATSPTMKNAVLIPATTSTAVSHYAERDKKGFFIFKIFDRKTEAVKGYFTDEGKKAPWFPQYELSSKDDKTAIDVTKTNEALYRATADNLKPNTTYYYQVGNAGNFSPVGQFKTAGAAGAEFSFIQYTDSQNAYYNEHINNEARYAADTLAQAQKIAPNAGFVLHTGDFVEIAEVEDEWVDLLGQSQKSLLKMSLVPVAGNHDEFSISRKELLLNKFNDHFNVDSVGKIDGGSYYSFDYNGVHFAVLNTNDYKGADKKAIGAEQMAWLKADLKKAKDNGAKWLIVTYHKPLFSKGYHSLQDSEVQNVRDEFMQTLDELGVDLALQGHDHIYSRTKSLSYAPKETSFVNAKVEDVKYTYNGQNIKTFHKPKGTIFMVPNTAGTKSYDLIFNRPLAHIHKMRPKLNWLTQTQLDHYNSLFEVGFQPHASEIFDHHIGNDRDNINQNFAVYTIKDNRLTATVYQVSGNLGKGEKRKVFKVDEFVIEK